MNRAKQAVTTSLLLIASLSAQSHEAATKPCPIVVVKLATEFIYQVSQATLPRVEVRHCDGVSDTLQLAAWQRNGSMPALIVDTGDFGVIQAAARGNVFVIETSGATTDTVYLIDYEHGRPKLILKRVSHETAEMRVTDDAIELTITGLSLFGQPDRTEQHRYLIDPHAMDPSLK